MNTKIVAKTMKVESNRNVSNYVFQFKIFFFLGLWPLKSLKLEPKTCSQRVCFYSQLLPHSIWKSEQVNSHQYNIHKQAFFNYFGCAFPNIKSY